MGEAAEPVAAEIVGPVVQFSCDVGHLNRHSVAVRPSGREAEEVAQWPRCAEECVQWCFSSGVIRAGWQAERGMFVVEFVVGGLEEDQLGQGLERGNVGLGAFGEERPGLAEILDVPGVGEPDNAGACSEPAAHPDCVAIGARVGRGHADKAWWVCQRCCWSKGQRGEQPGDTIFAVFLESGGAARGVCHS